MGDLNCSVVCTLNFVLLKLIDLFSFSSFNPAAPSLTFLSPQWKAWFSFAKHTSLLQVKHPGLSRTCKSDNQAPVLFWLHISINLVFSQNTLCCVSKGCLLNLLKIFCMGSTTDVWSVGLTYQHADDSCSWKSSSSCMPGDAFPQS